MTRHEEEEENQMRSSEDGHGGRGRMTETEIMGRREKEYVRKQFFLCGKA